MWLEHYFACVAVPFLSDVHNESDYFLEQHGDVFVLICEFSERSVARGEDLVNVVCHYAFASPFTG